MKLGPAAMVVALAASASLGGLGGLGCSHQPPPPPAQPSEPPPLPPPSGTPIGHLIDDADELALSADQLDKLKALSDELANQLAGDDSGLHADPVPASQREDKERGRGFGFRGGGARGDGGNGGTEVFPDAPRGNGDDGSDRAVAVTSEQATKVYRDRARHVREAIRRALALLDARQRGIARRVLTDHGVDLETGELRQLDAAKLEEPKLGQPLPREQEPAKPSKRK